MNWQKLFKFSSIINFFEVWIESAIKKTKGEYCIKNGNRFLQIFFVSLMDLKYSFCCPFRATFALALRQGSALP